jgi:serine protease Do
VNRLASALCLQRDIAALAERIRGSMVEIRSGRQSLGAGIAWGEDLLLTNAHVATAERVVVGRPDGAGITGQLVARDPRRDLALVHVPRLMLEPVTLRGTDRLRPGMLAFALGHPRGVIGALTAGTVHAIGTAPAPIPGRHASALRWLQLDLEVAPGNSGGPVLDATGAVVGITTMIVGGLTLAVPGEEALRWATRRLQAWRRSAS